MNKIYIQRNPITGGIYCVEEEAASTADKEICQLFHCLTPSELSALKAEQQRVGFNEGWDYCQKQYLQVDDPEYRGTSLNWRRDEDYKQWQSEQQRTQEGGLFNQAVGPTEPFEQQPITGVIPGRTQGDTSKTPEKIDASAGFVHSVDMTGGEK